MKYAAAALLFFCSAANAQIVNVQPLVAKSEMKQGLALIIEGAVDWRYGNIDLLVASGSLLARYRHGRHHLFLMARGEFGVKSGADFLSKDLEHLRYRVNMWGPLDGEAFVQHDGDKFRRLQLRAVAGMGPRLRVVMTHLVEAAVAVAYMLDYEEIRKDSLPDAGATRLMHRISCYAVVNVRATKRLTLGQTVYVQPRIGLYSDLRLLSDSELLTTITGHLALKLGLSLAFNTVPPIAIEPFDATSRVILQITF